MGAAAAAGGVSKVPASTLLTTVVTGTGSSLAQTAARQVILDDLFADKYVKRHTHGEYAGPPWPFRQQMQKFRITGGPKLPCATNANQVWIKPSTGLNIIEL